MSKLERKRQHGAEAALRDAALASAALAAAEDRDVLPVDADEVQLPLHLPDQLYLGCISAVSRLYLTCRWMLTRCSCLCISQISDGCFVTALLRSLNSSICSFPKSSAVGAISGLKISVN